MSRRSGSAISTRVTLVAKGDGKKERDVRVDTMHDDLHTPPSPTAQTRQALSSLSSATSSSSSSSSSSGASSLSTIGAPPLRDRAGCLPRCRALVNADTGNVDMFTSVVQHGEEGEQDHHLQQQQQPMPVFTAQLGHSASSHSYGIISDQSAVSPKFATTATTITTTGGASMTAATTPSHSTASPAAAAAWLAGRSMSAHLISFCSPTSSSSHDPTLSPTTPTMQRTLSSGGESMPRADVAGVTATTATTAITPSSTFENVASAATAVGEEGVLAPLPLSPLLPLQHQSHLSSMTETRAVRMPNETEARRGGCGGSGGNIINNSSASTEGRELPTASMQHQHQQQSCIERTKGAVEEEERARVHDCEDETQHITAYWGYSENALDSADAAATDYAEVRRLNVDFLLSTLDPVVPAVSSRMREWCRVPGGRLQRQELQQEQRHHHRGDFDDVGGMEGEEKTPVTTEQYNKKCLKSASASAIPTTTPAAAENTALPPHHVHRPLRSPPAAASKTITITTTGEVLRTDQERRAFSRFERGLCGWSAPVHHPTTLLRSAMSRPVTAPADLDAWQWLRRSALENESEVAAEAMLRAALDVGKE